MLYAFSPPVSFADSPLIRGGLPIILRFLPVYKAPALIRWEFFYRLFSTSAQTVRIVKSYNSFPSQQFYKKIIEKWFKVRYNYCVIF